MLGRSLQQIKSDVGEKGDLGIVAEVCVLNTILKLFMKNAIITCNVVVIKSDFQLDNWRVCGFEVRFLVVPSDQ